MSRSMHTLRRAHSEATSPSSHAAMVPSQLSSSLSRARSYARSSSNTADVVIVPGGEEGLQSVTSDDQRHDKKQAEVAASVD
jgi:hypothetical protein